MTAAIPPGHGIVVGTSGYSFSDWVGPFYPPRTRSGDFLAYYARHFDAVEVNSTYYRIPPARMIEQMEQKTPPGFRFVVKLHQSMTHERERDPALYREFLAAIEPLKIAGKLDGLLAQFPWSFQRTSATLDHLGALRERLPGEPLFVEFRHASWDAPETAPWLREHGLGFCAVDEPALEGLMPPVTMVTAADAYVRFHGRNARNWWGGGGSGRRDEERRAPARPRAPAPPRRTARAAAPSLAPDLFGEVAPEAGHRARPGTEPAPPAPAVPSTDRYDYDYPEVELRGWLDKIRELASQARRTYLFFNNCHAGQAARNAKLMTELLRQQKLPVATRQR
jgi:uncharacterized protein YecE (DUF72 family)